MDKSERWTVTGWCGARWTQSGTLQTVGRMQTVQLYSRGSFLKLGASCLLIFYFGPSSHPGQKCALGRQMLTLAPFPHRDEWKRCPAVSMLHHSGPLSGTNFTKHTKHQQLGYESLSSHVFLICFPQCQKEVGKNYLSCAYYQSRYCHS